MALCGNSLNKIPPGHGSRHHTRSSLKLRSQEPMHFNLGPARPRPQTTEAPRHEGGISPLREFLLHQQQNLSSASVSRLDVVLLQEDLNTKLLERQAKETGICPLRRELYSQCLDELIRQVTIECDERGLLLLRLKDEIELSLSAYQTLYETGVGSGMRKFEQAEQGKGDMKKRISKLENVSYDLRKELDKEKAKCVEIERNATQMLQVENERLTGDIESLKRGNEQLKTQLQAMKTKNLLQDD